MIAHRPRKLVSVTHEYEAGLIAASLTEHGIESHVLGGVMADFRAECPGFVDIMVAEEDMEAAARVLNNLDTSVEEIDWDNVDVGEPDVAVPEPDSLQLPSRSYILAVVIGMSLLYVITAIVGH